MEGTYRRSRSEALGRDMEYKVFGRAGRVCLAFPSQSGRFYDWEDFGMVECLGPWLDTGALRLVLVDSLDDESWCAPGPYHERMERHELWVRYVCDELLPEVEASGEDGPARGRAMVTGCSMGAMHAANLFFRRPDLFDAVVALSGIYTADYFFPGYDDPLIYENSPEDYLAGMPADHPYMERYRASRIVLCCGQGAWEDDLLASTRRLEATLGAKGVPAWVDYWGHDVSHDWQWWQRQLPYFMGYLLG